MRRIAASLAVLSLPVMLTGCDPYSMAAGVAAKAALSAARSIANSPEAKALVAGVASAGLEPQTIDQAAMMILANEQQGLVLLKTMVDPVTARTSWQAWLATRSRQQLLGDRWLTFSRNDPERAKQVAATYNPQINAVLLQELFEMQRISSDAAIQQELASLARR